MSPYPLIKRPLHRELSCQSKPRILLKQILALEGLQNILYLELWEIRSMEVKNVEQMTGASELGTFSHTCECLASPG
jgi:hypothetical protein